MFDKNYTVDNFIAEDPKPTWNKSEGRYVEAPEEFIQFLKEYEDLCKKHNISLSHEDGHGGFLIEPYDKSNIRWVCDAADSRTSRFEF